MTQTLEQDVEVQEVPEGFVRYTGVGIGFPCNRLLRLDKAQDYYGTPKCPSCYKRNWETED